MNILRVTKQFNFESAHALYGYDGKCKNIHGHSYKLFITVKGTPITDTTNPKLGMIIDFSDLKNIVHENIINILDHSVLLNKNSKHKYLCQTLINMNHKVVQMNFQPSCENIVIWILDKLKNKLPNNINIASIKLYETENSYAEWKIEDNV